MWPQLLLLRLDVVDSVLDGFDFLGVFIRDVKVESLFKSHHQFDDVERVGAEIIDERGTWLDLALVYPQLFDDDLLYFLCYRHLVFSCVRKLLVPPGSAARFNSLPYLIVLAAGRDSLLPRRLPCKHQSTGLNILYLHGFASGPHSRKAQFFKEKLGLQGIRLEIPDLAEGDFEHLTIRRQIKFIEQLAGNEAVTLIGSSLGGYLAALYAARHREVEQLVLLAPAFGFHSLWVAALGNERLAEWRSEGAMNVFHYGEGRELRLSYDFLKEAEELDSFPRVSQPVLIFHGDRDSVVPVEQSIEFVKANPHARLVRFGESGHELTDVLESIWRDAENFLLGRTAF